jgi:hypothetical protein
MSYNPFSTQKNKLAKAELDNQKQDNAISLKKWIESNVNKRVVTTQPRNTTLPRTTQWDSEWVTVTENNTDYLWANWNLDFGQFNQNWLSRFAIEIIVKDIGGLYSIEVGYGYGKSVSWDIKDIEESPGSNIKNIKLNAGLFVHKVGTPIFQAKLLVKYIAQATHD